MDVSEALLEENWLEFRDEVFLQPVDYEQIPFRDCPLNKSKDQCKEYEQKDVEGFVKPNTRAHANKRQQQLNQGGRVTSKNSFRVISKMV